MTVPTIEIVMLRNRDVDLGTHRWICGPDLGSPLVIAANHDGTVARQMRSRIVVTFVIEIYHKDVQTRPKLIDKQVWGIEVWGQM